MCMISCRTMAAVKYVIMRRPTSFSGKVRPRPVPLRDIGKIWGISQIMEVAQLQHCNLILFAEVITPPVKRDNILGKWIELPLIEKAGLIVFIIKYETHGVPENGRE